MTKKSNIEVNGPANILMLLDLFLQAGKIDKLVYNNLKTQAENTAKYIRCLENPSDIKWDNIIKNNT